MKFRLILAAILMTISAPVAHALVYSGAMDSRAGFQHIPGFIAQSKAFKAGGNPGEGLRLEWQVDNATTHGFWTYTYRLIRGTAKSKGFAFFDIETAADFTAANIVQRKVSWATDRGNDGLPSGLSSVTISDPASFTAVHDFSNAAVTEADSSPLALSKNDLSHYSGDPGIAAPGVPAGDASDSASVGPVAHPFYGIRVTFPGSNADLAYEAVEWEFSITSDRAPMWGSFFGWGDKTLISPFWYANFYNANIDNPDRLNLPPADNLYGAAPYEGWILVPGPQVAAQPSRLTVESATYQRSSGGDGNLTILATARSVATLTVSGEGLAPVTMTANANIQPSARSFSAQIPFLQLPSPLTVSNSLDPVSVAPHTIPLVDVVTISQATYNPATRQLTIKAASSDKAEPLPTLTARDFALPNTLDAAGILVKTLTANPPRTITVTSSRGGTGTAQIIHTAVSNFTITAAAAANGSISPSGSTVVTPGASQSYTITPNPGYTVALLVVDGVTLPAATSHTFSNVTTDHYINAYFAPVSASANITAGAATGGSISPAGVTTVVTGADQAYTITPNPGFTVSALVVDGQTLPGATTHTFTNVTADHYINAYFEALPSSVTITSAAASGGTISPSGATSVATGADQTYTITPDSGFIVAALVVDGVLQPGATSFTFTNVTADHYINAYFSPQ